MQKRESPPKLDKLLNSYASHLDLLRLDREKNMARFSEAERRLRERYEVIRQQKDVYHFTYTEMGIVLVTAGVVIFFMCWICDWLLHG